MATPNISAVQTRYRKETIAEFEQSGALLKETVIRDIEPHGDSVIFLLGGSGDARPVKRGYDGKIPPRQDQLTQFTCKLEAFYDKPIREDFNIWSSQDHEHALQDMKNRTVGVMNRECDRIIFNALGQATTTQTGITEVGLGQMIANLETTIKDNMGVKIYGVISPAMRQQMMQFKSFASMDYIDAKPFPKDKQMAFSWNGVHWMVHRAVPNAGTANAECYLYASTAVGFAHNKDMLSVEMGYNSEEKYSYAITTAYMGSLLLMNEGVIKITHDDTTISADGS